MSAFVTEDMLESAEADELVNPNEVRISVTQNGYNVMTQLSHFHDCGHTCNFLDVNSPHINCVSSHANQEQLAQDQGD